MQEEYDFSNAKRASSVPHLNRLRQQQQAEVVDKELIQKFKARFGDNYVSVINSVLQQALEEA